MEKITKIREQLLDIRLAFKAMPSVYAKQYCINPINEALALIDEMEKEEEFTVRVNVPNLIAGYCNLDCPLLKQADFFYPECYNGYIIGKKEKPGPGCPRFKGEPNG